MICKSCGKPLNNGAIICPNCGVSMQTMSFQTNRLGENGKRGEYVTEKYTGQQGLYEGKAHEHNNTYIGIIVVLVIILIIIAIAAANFLM